MSIRLEFDDDLLDALRIPPDEQEQRLKRELSLRLYEKGLLTLGKARQMSGMDKWEFLLLLSRENISRHYDRKELDRDLSTLDNLP